MATGYLLSTLALLDRLSGQDKYPVGPWLESKKSKTADVYLSALSIGVARQVIDRKRGTLRSRYLFALEATTHAMGSYIIPVELRHMKAWADILNHQKVLLRYESRKGKSTIELDDIDRLIVAMAVVDNLTLVERAQPYHRSVSALKVETLGE